MIIVVKKRGFNPAISRCSGKRMSTTIHTIAIFIIRLDSPNVSILNGVVIRFRIGFIKKFIRPKIVPASKRDSIDPSKLTPDINWVASQTPRIPARI